MKRNLNKKALLLIALLFAIVVPVTVFCQPTPNLNDVDAPLDGGISLLLAAGAVAGAKKVRDSRKK